MRLCHQLICIALLLLIRCSGVTDSAGGASDTEVGRIAGTARSSTGDILPRATIDLFHSDTAGSTDETPVRSTTADAAGAFVFEKVPFGIYRLQGISKDSSQVFVSPGIQLDYSSKHHTVDMKMETGGAIYGIHSSGFVKPREIWCLNTAFRAPLRDDLSFFFPLLPDGMVALMTVIVDTTTGVRVAVAIDTVGNTPNKTDTLSIFPAPTPLFDEDSLIVGDFENESYQTPFGTTWIRRGNTLETAFEIVSPGAEQSSGALSIACSGQTNKKVFGFLLGDTVAGLPRCRDLTGLSGVSFVTKGTGGQLRLLLESPVAGDISVVTIDAIPENWTRFSVFTEDFDLSERPGALEAVGAVRFEVISKSEGLETRCMLDNVTFFFE